MILYYCGLPNVNKYGGVLRFQPAADIYMFLVLAYASGQAVLC
jgi:hypothetical protein